MARSTWRLSGYRVEELLGAGASGEVWRARVTETGVAVALKRIWLSDPAQRKAALSEAAMLSSLDHPHLMKLHELRHVDDDAIVLVLDLAGAGSLASLLARRGRLTVGEAITAIAPIGAALAYAHHCGVVHGDVSSANILFTDIGLPLLADLGVARLLGDSHPVRTTPAYADPAVAGGALPGPASDVFMLGAVALHVLTGTPAWSGTDPAEVLEAAASGEQPDFAGRLARAGVPEPVATVVARALSVDPMHRGTAADLALELRHAGEPVAVELSAGRPRLTPVVASTGARAGLWPLESWPLDAVPAREPVPSPNPVSAAPPFVGEQPLTYGVRAPAPFATPAARHLARSRPRVATGFALASVLLAVLAATGVWWWSASGADGPSRATLERASSVARVSTSVPTPRPTASVPSPTAAPSPLPGPAARRGPAALPDRARVRSALVALDRERSAAFGHRDPSRLVSVYADPGLLARDTALLTSIVPAGCALRGVHTSFTDLVVIRPGPARVSVRVRSELAPSTLVCGGTPSARAPAGPAIILQITLVRYGHGYRIAAQRQL